MRNQIENNLLNLEKKIPFEVAILAIILCAFILGLCVGMFLTMHS